MTLKAPENLARIGLMLLTVVAGAGTINSCATYSPPTGAPTTQDGVVVSPDSKLSPRWSDGLTLETAAALVRDAVHATSPEFEAHDLLTSPRLVGQSGLYSWSATMIAVIPRAGKETPMREVVLMRVRVSSREVLVIPNAKLSGGRQLPRVEQTDIGLEGLRHVMTLTVELPSDVVVEHANKELRVMFTGAIGGKMVVTIPPAHILGLIAAAQERGALASMPAARELLPEGAEHTGQ